MIYKLRVLLQKYLTLSSFYMIKINCKKINLLYLEKHKLLFIFKLYYFI